MVEIVGVIASIHWICFIMCDDPMQDCISVHTVFFKFITSIRLILTVGWFHIIFWNKVTPVIKEYTGVEELHIWSNSNETGCGYEGQGSTITIEGPVVLGLLLVVLATTFTGCHCVPIFRLFLLPWTKGMWMFLFRTTTGYTSLMKRYLPEDFIRLDTTSEFKSKTWMSW